MTIFFRQLSELTKANTAKECFSLLRIAFYDETQLTQEILKKWYNWLDNYLKILQRDQRPDVVRQQSMKEVNPKYVLRNYMAQMAIDNADDGDYSLIEELYQLLKRPYDEQPKLQKWYAKRPEWARHKVGCSMLSCSS
jgi:uncharacterized protein YdiU (UPF0061 family)